MLTNTNKRNSWKYLFAVPVLLTCTFVFARSNPSNQRVRLEHVTTYNGHRFYWEKSKVDSIQVMDPTTRETTWVVMKKQPVIHKMDDDSVYSSEFKSIRPPYFNADGNDFHEYVIGKFHAIHKTFPDSVNTITLNNIIVDQQGRVAYFDIQCSTDRGDYDISSDQGAYASYSKTVHKIIAESPDWQPATLNNRNVHCRMDGFNVYFKRTEK